MRPVGASRRAVCLHPALATLIYCRLTHQHCRSASPSLTARLQKAQGSGAICAQPSAVPPRELLWLPRGGARREERPFHGAARVAAPRPSRPPRAGGAVPPLSVSSRAGPAPLLPRPLLPAPGPGVPSGCVRPSAVPRAMLPLLRFFALPAACDGSRDGDSRYANLFKKLDLNEDGRVDIAELQTGLQAMGIPLGKEAEEVGARRGPSRGGPSRSPSLVPRVAERRRCPRGLPGAGAARDAAVCCRLRACSGSCAVRL